MDPKDNIPNFFHVGPPTAEESYGSNNYCANEGKVPLHPAADDEEVQSARVFTVEELVDRMFPEDLLESEELDDSNMYKPVPRTRYYALANPKGTDS